CLPIPLISLLVERIEHALQRRVGHGGHKFEEQRRNLAHLGKEFLRLLLRASVAPDHTTDVLQVNLFRERRARWHDKESKEAVYIIRLGRQKFPIPLHDLLRVLHLPEGEAGCDRLNRMQAELEGGDNAEVATS